MWLASRAR